MEINTATPQLNTSDGKMEAYEARPRDGRPSPGIVLLMEAFGVDSHIKDVTERFAREGYVVVAPDLYHRESERIIPYTELQKAVGIMRQLQDPKMMEDVGAAITHLKSQGYVKQGTIGVVGFCMGGRFAYLAAAHHNKDIKAAVSFYGGRMLIGSPSPLDRTGEIGCPILVIFGGKDPLIPQEEIEKINKALTDQKKNFTIKVYPEAGHSFFNNDRHRYDPEATKDSWERTKSFFAQHLK